MRAALLLLLLTFVVPAPARAAFSAADRASFAALAQELPGGEGVAISAGGEVLTLGSVRTGTAWSTAKVPVAMAAVQARSARSADLTAALTASDNAAAERLFAGLGSPASAARRATAQLRAAGDPRTVVQSRRTAGAGYTAFGQTAWRLGDQARFAFGLSCSAAGRRVAALMRRVVSGQRWGLGTLDGAAFKGGWGPGSTPGRIRGWLDRQFGVVRIDGTAYGIAVASTAPDHTAGPKALTRLAAWAAAHADAAAPGAAPCSGQ